MAAHALSTAKQLLLQSLSQSCVAILEIRPLLYTSHAAMLEIRPLLYASHALLNLYILGFFEQMVTHCTCTAC